TWTDAAPVPGRHGLQYLLDTSRLTRVRLAPPATFLCCGEQRPQMRRIPRLLVEQRLKAVQEVLDGATVTDVARRNGVTRQTVHTWLRRYANHGIAGLVDKTSKPESCPHQMTPVIEARLVEMRRTHPAWGPRTIRTHLAREGTTPLPGRSSIYRALVRHRLLEPTQRKRTRSDYKRWERSRSMELWQMDVVGRFHLADGTEVKVVTGVDDHSRFCVCARVVL